MEHQPESASQTAGPYVHIGCVPSFAGLRKVYEQEIGQNLRAMEGVPITLEGIIYDGEGAPVLDALVELWQADGAGHYGSGFGRCPSDAETGLYRFETVMPGTAANGQAPHVALWIVARGINLGLHTRVYFDNTEDSVLAQVDPARQSTLIARKSGDVYRHDIHLQGDHETVFFDV